MAYYTTRSLNRALEENKEWVRTLCTNGSETLLSPNDLSHCDISNCNLSALSVPLIPVIPNIHRTLHEAASPRGSLNMCEWHTCDTTHCRAGWVVHLAGDAGARLERSVGTAAAAALIYMASDPSMELTPGWYCSNAFALADMKRLADMEQCHA